MAVRQAGCGGKEGIGWWGGARAGWQPQAEAHKQAVSTVKEGGAAFTAYPAGSSRLAATTGGQDGPTADAWGTGRVRGKVGIGLWLQMQTGIRGTPGGRDAIGPRTPAADSDQRPPGTSQRDLRCGSLSF